MTYDIFKSIINWIFQNPSLNRLSFQFCFSPLQLVCRNGGQPLQVPFRWWSLLKQWGERSRESAPPEAKCWRKAANCARKWSPVQCPVQIRGEQQQKLSIEMLIDRTTSSKPQNTHCSRSSPSICINNSLALPTSTFWCFCSSNAFLKLHLCRGFTLSSHWVLFFCAVLLRMATMIWWGDSKQLEDFK